MIELDEKRADKDILELFDGPPDDPFPADPGWGFFNDRINETMETLRKQEFPPSQGWIIHLEKPTR